MFGLLCAVVAWPARAFAAHFIGRVDMDAVFDEAWDLYFPGEKRPW